MPTAPGGFRCRDHTNQSAQTSPYIGQTSASGTLLYPPRGENHRGHVARNHHRYDIGYGVVDGTPIHSMMLPPLIGTRTSPRVDTKGGPSFQDYWRRTGYEGAGSDSYQATNGELTQQGVDVAVGGFRQGATTSHSAQTDPYVGTSMPTGTLYYPPVGDKTHRADAPTLHWPRFHGDSAHFFVNGVPVQMMEEPSDDAC